VGLRGHAALNALLLSAALIAATDAGVRAQSDIDGLLARVAERIAEFYKRASSIVCNESSTVQGIDGGFSPQGFARTVESQLHVEMDGGDLTGEATVVRNIRTVNGRVPRERDKKDRDGCTDPNPLSSEPLAFLLPAHRSAYQFRIRGTGTDRSRPAIVIEFATINRRSNPELIEDPGGHDDCFDWNGNIALKGRIWVDAETYDVLRVERGLAGPVDVRVPFSTQRRHHLAPSVVLLRDDLTIRYKKVAFSDPDEVLLVPESIESLTVVQGGLQSTRRSQTFSDYKRFVTEGRILQ
jgi:hypothetical protein